MSAFEPHATECSNPGRDDFWTCPGCYHDLGDVGEGEQVCPNCDRAIHCTVENFPSCHCRLLEEETDQ